MSFERKRVKVSVGRISPPFGSREKFCRPASISGVVRTGVAIACTPCDGAAASIDRMKNLDCGDVSGLNITAARERLGAISLSRSTHFPPTENSYTLKPVRLPPGLRSEEHTSELQSLRHLV